MSTQADTAAGTGAGGAAKARELTVVSTGGARLHTEVHGREDGPTVVLAHGWICRISFWHPVLERLARDHRVVVYDQRGHGRSPATPGSCSSEALADDLCAVLAATVPAGTRAVVGGHSMGAMAVVAAADRPELRDLAAAVLLCSTGADRLAGESTVVPLRPGTARRLAHRLLLRSRLPFGPVTPVSRRVIRYITMAPGVGRELRARTARMVHDCPRRVRAEWGGVLYGLDVAERVPLLSAPVTIVQGAADRLTPAVHAHRIARRLPRLTALTELPGTGHMTPLEAPDVVADVLRGLVRDHMSPRAAGEPGEDGGTAAAARKGRAT